MQYKLIFVAFLLGVAGFLDQVLLTSKVTDANLRYSWVTLQRQSATGFIEPSCSAVAYRLTIFSRLRLRNNKDILLGSNSWRQGSGPLKLPTWGCGLAYYDHGGQGGRITRMYKWGEGRRGEVWFGQSDTECGDLAFVLVEEGRLLCVVGAG